MDMQGLIYKIRAASDIGQKGHFFKKKGTKIFATTYLIPIQVFCFKRNIYI